MKSLLNYLDTAHFVTACFVVTCFAMTCLIVSGRPAFADVPAAGTLVTFDYNGTPVQLSDFTLETVPGPADSANTANTTDTTDSADSSNSANRRFDTQTQLFTAPDGKLQVRLECKTYINFPVREYTIWLKNLSSTEPTGVVSNFQSLKMAVPLPEKGQSVVLETVHGSQCRADDFTPEQIIIPSGNEHTFTTPSGRSSSFYIPFLEMNVSETSGWIFAIGWTGSWQAKFAVNSDSCSVTAGMDRSNFKLLPGEEIRQPSITIMERTNLSRPEFKTLVHRFMIDCKAPRNSAGEVIKPILAVASGGGNKTPKMMKDILRYCLDNKLPFDTYWVDAGWYGAPHEDELYSNCGPNWWKYGGDWRVNTTTHPTGDLLPIADAVHAAGMNFLLWFEPERMMDSTPILAEHPEYRNGILVNYGNPEALAWIQDTVYSMIDKHGINVYRQDFNMDPRGVWISMETEPDRVGMAEARHITGMYKFLDDMRKRFPDILQENCASGGRRIDIEMNSRAHVYCRSDYYIGQKPGDTAFVLGQNATLNTTPFLPFQGCEFNCVPVGDNYAAFSIISSGTVITPSDFDGGIIRRKITDEETAWFKQVFDTAARMKPFYMGDFYPLTDACSADNDLWCAWQCHRPDLDAGFAIVFRRADNKEDRHRFFLGGIDPNAQYEVETFEGDTAVVKGTELQNMTLAIPARSFKLIFYKKK